MNFPRRRIPRQLPPAPQDRSALPDAPDWSKDTPLFASLAAQWLATGRTVPGHIDVEWATLTRRPRP